jgi:hypothetical protein
VRSLRHSSTALCVDAASTRWRERGSDGLYWHQFSSTQPDDLRPCARRCCLPLRSELAGGVDGATRRAWQPLKPRPRTRRRRRRRRRRLIRPRRGGAATTVEDSRGSGGGVSAISIAAISAVEAAISIVVGGQHGGGGGMARRRWHGHVCSRCCWLLAVLRGGGGGGGRPAVTTWLGRHIGGHGVLQVRAGRHVL